MFRLHLKLAVNSLVVHVQIRRQPLREHRPGQTLRDDKGIVAERFKEFAQHLGLFGVLAMRSISACNCSAVIGLLPVILQRL